MVRVLPRRKDLHIKDLQEQLHAAQENLRLTREELREREDDIEELKLEITLLSDRLDDVREALGDDDA